LDRYFHLFKKRKLACLLFDIDLRIVIEKVLNHVYAIGKSNIMLTWEYIVVLNIKGKHNLKQFTIYTL